MYKCFVLTLQRQRLFVNGKCILLEIILESFNYRVAIEIILKCVIGLKCWRDVSIFNRFQHTWETINAKNFNSGIQNTIVIDFIIDVCYNIIKFSKD